MVNETITKKQDNALDSLLKELRDIKNQLGKLLFLIPEESVKEYENYKQIKKAYFQAAKKFPPR